MNSDWFAKILRALPGSCKHLELDTQGADAESLKGHICPEIGRLLSQLTSLRLRLRSLCPRSFQPETTDAYFAASPLHTWISNHSKGPHSYELLGSDGAFDRQREDFAEWKRWKKLRELRRKASVLLENSNLELTETLQWWERTYHNDLQEPLNEASRVCPHLETCIINLCLYAHLPNTSLHSEFKESGVVAAATIVVNLPHTMNMSNTFPSLRSCKLVSTDFEL